MYAFQPPLIPAPTDIRRDNPRFQGEIGLTDAIAWFGHHGYRIAIPLADNQEWDLVVEDAEGRLFKVQVKTATHLSPYGVFRVNLKTAGGNQSFHTTKPFDPEDVDLLYVLTDQGDRYVIPTEAIHVGHQLSLGAKMERYRI